ncbi:hypothetical protein [Flavivirga algicola]|uniref:Uncharacterized protein n=1 Tax=Flavivirga algicola TaxID=2729136 RepID=A0ABX1RZ49_9FLAO|nr:hypothetical protein [Flavivirga algicola]NMH88847.1 hypothetical protein [Flavivirga algicola]
MDSKSDKIASKEQINNQKLLDKDIHKLHTETLGLDVPENYFSRSKANILTKVSDEAKQEKPVFFLKRRFAWYAAASVILLLAITFTKSNGNLQLDENHPVALDTIKELDGNKFAPSIIEPIENDILITSLFIEEDEVDEFIDNYVLEEALTYEAL